MGRILDVLRQANGENLNGADSRTQHSDQQPTESVPFIEVGGPSKQIEASADVLARAAASESARPTAPVASPPHGVTYHPTKPAISLARPADRFARDLIVYHQPHHARSLQYHAVLAGVCGQAPAAEGRGIGAVRLVAAVSNGVGATTTVLNLAIAKAQESADKVLVVDANLRKPAIHLLLGLPARPGLREVIARTVLAEESIQATGVPRLWALTAGDGLAGDQSWPSARSLCAVLEGLCRHADWVFVDGPCWKNGPEIASLASACPRAFLVVSPRELQTQPVQDLSRLLSHVGCQVGGFIVAGDPSHNPTANGK